MQFENLVFVIMSSRENIRLIARSSFWPLLPLEHSAIILTCIKRYLVLENQFLFFLKVAVLDDVFLYFIQTVFHQWALDVSYENTKPHTYVGKKNCQQQQMCYACWVISHASLSSADFFKSSFKTIRVSSSLALDQT